MATDYSGRTFAAGRSDRLVSGGLAKRYQSCGLQSGLFIKKKNMFDWHIDIKMIDCGKQKVYFYKL
jgi:hypothetical protein